MKERIDILLVERRLVESRVKAQWLIKNGLVLVNGIEIIKPGKKIDNSLEIQLKSEFPYVGKGGLKLEAALKEFNISVKGKVCIDIGSSIGGFTDCLIKQDALRVYAVDTATDLLHPSLRCEKMKNRVIPLLGVDARKLTEMQEMVDLCTIDITFASIKEILPIIKQFLKKEGEIISLIKPIFETEYYNTEKFKVVKEKSKLKSILLDSIRWSLKNDIYPYGIMKSPILGKGGSIEFLIYYKVDRENIDLNYESRINELIYD
ncbi:MAG: TlyA family RNA methyltransferase [Candidatus Hermodarchaeota archaeon]